MDWHTLLFLLVAALGAFVQGASGFAFALIASALWAWLIEPQVLAPTVMLTSLLGQVSSLVRVADKVRARPRRPFPDWGYGRHTGRRNAPAPVRCREFSAGDWCRAGGLLPAKPAAGVPCHWSRGAAGWPTQGSGPSRASWVGPPVSPAPPSCSGAPCVAGTRKTQRATYQSFFVGIGLVILVFQPRADWWTSAACAWWRWPQCPSCCSPGWAAVSFGRLDEAAFRRLILWLLLISGAALIAGGH
jgi:hypothetical protein